MRPLALKDTMVPDNGVEAIYLRAHGMVVVVGWCSGGKLSLHEAIMILIDGRNWLCGCVWDQSVLMWYRVSSCILLAANGAMELSGDLLVELIFSAAMHAEQTSLL